MKPRLVRANLGKIAFSFIFFATISALSADGHRESGAGLELTQDTTALARLQSPPLGLPVVPVPENNPGPHGPCASRCLAPPEGAADWPPHGRRSDAAAGQTG